jgi:3-deoxy-manno-octulosonate cytidylyltransferase (CMP-KDO synthetase)
MRALARFCALTPAPIEHIEKLEQLRTLHYGYEVAMTEVKTESFGIDTPEDLQKALQHHRL